MNQSENRIGTESGSGFFYSQKLDPDLVFFSRSSDANPAIVVKVDPKTISLYLRKFAEVKHLGKHGKRKK